jgi:predicted transcriptional regulator
MKKDLGAGKTRYKSLIDPITGEDLAEPVIVYGLKSLRDYTKKERMDFISNLIAQMEMVGVDTPKYREILQGMEINSMRAAV